MLQTTTALFQIVVYLGHICTTRQYILDICTTRPVTRKRNNNNNAGCELSHFLHPTYTRVHSSPLFLFVAHNEARKRNIFKMTFLCVHTYIRVLCVSSMVQTKVGQKIFTLDRKLLSHAIQTTNHYFATLPLKEIVFDFDAIF